VSVPKALVAPIVELVELIGEDLVFAALKNLIVQSRESQLKANYEAGKRVFKRGKKT
jgi:hypothetical protein